MSKPRVTCDFETRSKCDLKKAGAYKYSLDPSTQPTCFSFKIHGESTVYFLDFYAVNRPWEEQPTKLRQLWVRLIEGGYLFSAHNAFFERCIYTNILVARYRWPEIPPELWHCTAAKAAACALPRNLEGAGAALRLSVQKDKRGYAAMMATCKPTRQWAAWKKAQDHALAASFNPKLRITPRMRNILAKGEPKVFLEPEDAPETWDVLYRYNKTDTRAEEAIDDALPDLIPVEREIWLLNQTLNWRGLRVDIPTVEKIVRFIELESKTKLKELDALTMGLVDSPNARDSILEFLALEGVELPNLRAKTVDDFLKAGNVTGDMKRLLEIRKALSMASTKKYQGFLARAGDDHRVRDILMYHGASTGRDTGTGIQPHNFPRGLIRVDKNRPYAAVENVIECDVDMLRLFYGEALGVLFSAILRNMIIPSEGCELFVADFSKIEVAVLWWLADAVAGLWVLRKGLDPYKYQAAANTGLSYEEIADDSDDRQLGKAQVLGCGFGMGWERFKAAAYDMYRLKLTDEQAQTAVKSYRQTNPEVPALWKTYEAAAVAVVEQPGSKVSAGKCRFTVEREFLTIRLPSGRKLYYREPQIAWRETEYGPRKTLEFWGVNSKTKKWAIERTWGGTLTENVVQAAARDLMMLAILRLEKAGYRALLTVHDEGICEKPIGEGSVDEFVKILCEIPDWAKGLPVEAKGWKGPRYRK